MQNRLAIVVGLSFLIISIMIWSQLPIRRTPKQQLPVQREEARETESPRPTLVSGQANHPLPYRRDADYTSSEACIACHPTQHSSWHDSYHSKMTQWASPDTVIAPFDDVSLETSGQTAQLQRRGDEFWVNLTDPNWEKQKFEQWARTRGSNSPDPFESAENPPRMDAQVVMTTGSHHFQAYWIKGKDGRELWQFPWRFHIAEQRWVHRKDVFLTPPEWRPGMWFRVWNSQCIYCHSTGPIPGRDPNTGVMAETQIAELGIACEACHGPGEKHIAFRTETSVGPQPVGADPIVNPAKLSHDQSAQVCGSCHSHFEHADPMLAIDGPDFRPGKNLFLYGSLQKPPRRMQVMSRFWGDGTNRSGGREFSGMSSSRCYQQGEIACTSCHSMHESDPNDQLSPTGLTSNACLQCHEQYRDSEQLTNHTHHTANSAGSDCYNCHMPHTNYALFKGIRSHTIDSPRVTSLNSNTRPNACNLCHLDQSLQWTADHLQDWYNLSSPFLNEDDQTYAAGILWALKGDAGQRVIAAWHFGWEPARQASGHDWMMPIVAELMKDPYAAVRWIAFDVLRRFPAFKQEKFDFDADESERHDSVDQILRRWQSNLPPTSVNKGAQVRLLLTENGEPDIERTKELLKRRDKRMVAGVE